jgi:hypothetical protein
MSLQMPSGQYEKKVAEDSGLSERRPTIHALCGANHTISE